MGTPLEPQPTKYFVAFLVADLALLADVEAELTAVFGEIDARATPRAWQESKFYEAEMGRPLWRGFWSLQSLRGAEELVTAKLRAQSIEVKFRDPVSGSRRVNLDPGYLDRLKVVLASTKKRQSASLPQLGDLCRSHPVLSPWRIPRVALHLPGLFDAAGDRLSRASSRDLHRTAAAFGCFGKF